MVSGINRMVIIILTFISAIIFMVGLYSLTSWIYEQVFIVSSHRSVGMIFISFFFMVIATPTLLLTLFSLLRINLTVFILAMLYLFYEWFSMHPLRVTLMGGCFLMSYLYVATIKKHFLSSNTKTGIYDWAKEFASAGVRKGREISRSKTEFEKDELGNYKRDKNHKKIGIRRWAQTEGASYYSGDGINKAHISPEEMVKVLEESKYENK